MNAPQTQMRREINEIPDAVERLLSEGAGAVTATAAEIRDLAPSYLLSVARGSSDHASTYLKYASELLLGLPMASVGPSVKSIYGVDLLEDNAAECRERLFEHFEGVYTRLFGEACRAECRVSARYVLDRNIICGDALTMKTVGRKPEPIVFSEWSPVNGSLVKRRDYSLAHLLVYQPMEGPSLFSDLGEEAFIPKPVRDFPLTHYLKLAEAEHA